MVDEGEMREVEGGEGAVGAKREEPKSRKVNSWGKMGIFDVEIAKMVEFPEREANSFTFQKKTAIFPQRCCKNRKM